MRHYLRVLIVSTNLLLISCQFSANSSDYPEADRIFLDGAIYTLEQSNPWAEVVAIKDGKIIYVGDKEGVEKYVGESTQKQDLNGKMLLPGFIDSHAHPVAGGAYVRSLSLDTFAEPQVWLKQIAEYSKQHPNQKILFGYGFLASAFGDNGPTSKMLDSVISDRPVFIMDEGFHGGWANSRAMRLLGINKQTADPTPGFSYYKRYASGEATGYLLEGTAAKAVEQLEIITESSVALGTVDVLKIMNSYGITSVFDAGALDVENIQVKVLKKIADEKNMTVRIVGAHMIAAPDKLDDVIKVVIDKKTNTKNPLFHINTLKIMNDGTIEGKTAGMFEDYQGEPDNRGETVFSQQQLTGLMTKASANNLDIHVHALGERTIHETLNAIEFAQERNPDSNSRYTICHLQVMTDKSIQRMAKLNVIAQSTPLWASYDEYGKAFVSDDQFQRYFRFNSLKKAGVKMAFGSDFPATGAGTLGISPVFNMEIGHTRQSAGEATAPVQPNIEERLDIATLIKGYTIDGAYQLHLEDKIGSIKVGKLADFVILDKNLFDVETYSIHKVKVIQTILAGNTVYLQE